MRRNYLFFLFLAVVAFSCNKSPIEVDFGEQVLLVLEDPKGIEEAKIGGSYSPGRHYVVPKGKKAVPHTLSTSPEEFQKVITVDDKNNLRCSFTGIVNYTRNPDFAENLLFKNTSAHKKLGGIVEAVEADIYRAMLWGENPAKYLSGDSLLNNAGITMEEFTSWSDYSYDRLRLSLLIQSEAEHRFRKEYPDMDGAIHLNFFLIIDHKIPPIVKERRLKETKESLENVVVPLEEQYQEVRIQIANRRANMNTEIDRYIEQEKRKALSSIRKGDEDYVARLEAISAMLRQGTTMYLTRSEFIDLYNEITK